MGKVDVLFGAHHHSYQRSCKLRRGRCVDDGMLIINLGNGGASNTPMSGNPKALWKFLTYKHGYVRTTADRTSIKFEYVYSDVGEVIDEVTLTKEYPPPGTRTREFLP